MSNLEVKHTKLTTQQLSPCEQHIIRTLTCMAMQTPSDVHAHPDTWCQVRPPRHTTRGTQGGFAPNPVLPQFRPQSTTSRHKDMQHHHTRCKSTGQSQAQVTQTKPAASPRTCATPSAIFLIMGCTTAWRDAADLSPLMRAS